MAKVKAPLFSLDARRSIGSTLTYTKRSGRHITESIPTHPDSRTLPQLYQRWRYQDAAFIWQTLTPAQKETWRAAGTPYGLTPFASFLRGNLSLLPNLIFDYRIDALQGTQVLDSSPHANHATNVNVTLVPGLIGRAGSFDGSTTSLTAPSSAPLDSLGSEDFTLCMFAYPFSHYDHGQALWKHTGAIGMYLYFPLAPSTLCSFGADWSGGGLTLNLGNLPKENFYHLTIARLSDTAYAYVDGILVDSGPFTGNASTTTPLRLGTRTDLVMQFFKGYIDAVQAWDVALSPAHIAALASRRFTLS